MCLIKGDKDRGVQKLNFLAGINVALISRINGTPNKAFLVEICKKLENQSKNPKIENLATLLQLTPFVGFLAMAEKIRSTRGNIT